MDETTFWNLIETAKSRAAGGSQELLLGILTEQLARLPTDEIIAFDRMFYVFRDILSHVCAFASGVAWGYIRLLTI